MSAGKKYSKKVKDPKTGRSKTVYYGAKGSKLLLVLSGATVTAPAHGGRCKNILLQQKSLTRHCV